MYYEKIDPEYRYYYDDWSTSPPSSLLRHQILVGYSEATVHDREKYFTTLCRWLEENVGKISKDWHFTPSMSIFYFKSMEDAMAFKLRWV